MISATVQLLPIRWLSQTPAPFFSGVLEEVNDRLSPLLQHHLSKTLIVKDEQGGTPFADPSRDLYFSSFASVYPQTDVSYEACLFRLGHTLFDPIDHHLSPLITVDVRKQIYSLRRNAALSAWLRNIVTSSVDAHLKQQGSRDLR